MPLSDMEVEDDWEETCEHDKWPDEFCEVCDTEDDDGAEAGADADGTDATDEPVDEV